MANAKTGGSAGDKKGAADKKAAPPGEAPKGKLTIVVWSGFTVDGKVDKNGRPAPRWGDKVTADNVIVGATVAVLGEGLTSEGTDKNQSATTIDLNRLKDGAYTLRLVPTAEQLGTVAAGPKLVPNVKKPKKGDPPPKKGALPAWADRMYRTIDLRIVWRNGALAQEPAVVDGLDRCRVIRFLPNLLEVDWKPDWVKAKNIHPRDPPKTLRQPAGSAAQPKAARVDTVVLHRTGAAEIGSSLSKFTSTQICSHYLVDVDGFAVKLVPEEYRGAHAGTGAVWDKEYVVNHFSIGIELVNETGTFPSAQMAGLVDLLQRVVTAHKIKRDRVVGHCEVEPLTTSAAGVVSNNRDDCPGKEFDWPLLEKKGLALAPLATRLPPHRFFRPNPAESLVQGDSDKTVTYGSISKRGEFTGTIGTIQDDLAVIGYEEQPMSTEKKALTAAGHHVFAVRGEYDDAMRLTVRRFQRRYLGDTRNVKVTPGEINRATSEMIYAVRYAKTRVL